MIIHVNKERGLFNFKYQDGDKLFFHTIKSNTEPNDDALFRIAFFSRPWNSNTYEISGLLASRLLIDFFENYYSCKIDTPRTEDIEDYTSDLYKDLYLGFSGGFDSIAAKAVLPETVKLFSIDFGGKFSRERAFFENYSTEIFEWDIRNPEKKFNERCDWRFLISPVLLKSSKPFRALSLATGTILEASPFWFSSEDRFKGRVFSNGGFGPGVNLIHPVAGLSEWGTTYIASRLLSKNHLLNSLDSLAPKNSLKRFRKELLLSIIEGNKIPKNNGNIKKHIFGSSFAEDILSLYFIWKLGFTWVEKNYACGVPKNSIFLDMSFMELLNEHNHAWNDPLLSAYISEKIRSFGIMPYSSTDYANLTRCKEFLSFNKI